MAAEITINQPTGAGAGSPNKARNDIWLDQEVQLVSSGTGTSWLWEMLDRPLASAATLAGSGNETSTFTPDIIGTYRIRLTIDGGSSYVVKVVRARYNSTGVLTNRGWAMPAVGEQRGEANYGTNERHWAEVWESIHADILDNILFSAGGDLSGTPSSQVVVGLQGRDVVDTAPSDGEALIWSTAGSQWEPTAIPAGFTAGGDISGTPTSQTVVGLQGRDVASTAPVDGQVVGWNATASQWEPKSASGAWSVLSDVATTAGSTSTLTTTADKRDVLVPGTPLRVLDRSGVEYNDGSNQLSGYAALTGVNSALLQFRGRLYVSIIDDTGGYYHIAVYKDAARTLLVGHTVTYNSTGSKTVLEDNDSGLGGNITVDAVVGADSDICVEFYKWYVVHSLTDTLITVRGPALSATAGDITAIWYGDHSKVAELPLFVPGDYAASSSSTLLASISENPERWVLPPSRVCKLRAWAGGHSGTSPITNVDVGGSPVCSSNSDDGLQVAAAATFYETTIDLNATNLAIEYGTDVEVTTTAGDPGGGDSNLSMVATVVLE